MVGWVVVVGAEGRWFDYTSSHHAGTLAKSFTRNCLYDVMWRPVAALRLKFDSCNSLLSFVHTLLVNILRCVRLYIKRKYYYYYYSYVLIFDNDNFANNDDCDDDNDNDNDKVMSYLVCYRMPSVLPSMLPPNMPIHSSHTDSSIRSTNLRTWKLSGTKTMVQDL